MDPNFHVRVGLHHPPVDDPDALPMWEMDDGIIEGALASRFSKDPHIAIQRIDGSGEPEDLWHYIIHKQTSDALELDE